MDGLSHKWVECVIINLFIYDLALAHVLKHFSNSFKLSFLS